MVTTPHCILGQPGPHFWICGSPYRPPSSLEAVVDKQCKLCGDARTVPAFGKENNFSIVISQRHIPESAKEVLFMATKAEREKKCVELNDRKDEIVNVWLQSGKNCHQAAVKLQIPNSTLMGKLQQWGLVEKKKPKRNRPRQTYTIIKTEHTNLITGLENILAQEKLKLIDIEADQNSTLAIITAIQLLLKRLQNYKV